MVASECDSRAINGSPIIDKWLFNGISIFFNLTTRMTILLFGRFLVFTCGSPILVLSFHAAIQTLIFRLVILAQAFCAIDLTALGLSAV